MTKQSISCYIFVLILTQLDTLKLSGRIMHGPRYVEPFGVPDTLVSGIASVEQISDDMYRFTFYVEQKSPVDGLPERTIVARLIGTHATIVASYAMKGNMLDQAVPKPKRRH